MAEPVRNWSNFASSATMFYRDCLRLCVVIVVVAIAIANAELAEAYKCLPVLCCSTVIVVVVVFIHQLSNTNIDDHFVVGRS